ncbi:acetyltransferase [Planctomycetales bacterium]|nr:acetyltransferase [Planctomycetales bacterium]GHT00407.1 acetyltransferase [Planctomycetales bacterium]GHT07496.1 acetyltransferase [Planctomycetales bacterium]
MRNNLIIFGCGGHARSVADVALLGNPNIVILFVDEKARDGEALFGFPVVKEYNVENENVFVAIGDNAKRRQLCEIYGSKLVNIISPRAYIGRAVEMGRGVFVAHGAHIGVGSKIGDFAIVNTNASIDHECNLGVASAVSPGVVLCGKVTLGNNTLLGANVSVRDGVTIGHNITVGAGAAVVKNIEKPGVYVGVPAKMKT